MAKISVLGVDTLR